jgi:uncharacterized protein (DUF2336 family)
LEDRANVNAGAAAEPLLKLARSRDPFDRERLLSGIAGLCESNPAGMGARAAAEVETIFLTVVAEAERDIRARLAERIARADWAPPRLIETLARDDIEVARPVIAASPLLKDAALIHLIAEATVAHRVEVARRADISASVVAAAIDDGEPDVLSALVANHSADITPPCMKRLVDHARTMAALGAPLAAHPRMNAELAQELYLWVGETIRRSIVARFDVDAAALNAAIAAAVAAAPERPRRLGPTASEMKLVGKLAAAGQLKPGYLLRVLKDRQLGLFESALAKLGGFRIEEVHKAVMHPSRPELMALACAAIGIDRSVFPTLLQLVRQCTDGMPGGGEEGARRGAAAFGPFSPETAALAFHQAIASV